MNIVHEMVDVLRDEGVPPDDELAVFSALCLSGRFTDHQIGDWMDRAIEARRQEIDAGMRRLAI